MMPRVQRADAECRKGVLNNGLAGFAGKSAPPECGPKLEAQLVDTLLVRLQPAAADMLPSLEKEEGPVLDPMLLVVIDLQF